MPILLTFNKPLNLQVAMVIENTRPFRQFVVLTVEDETLMLSQWTENNPI